MFNNPISGKYSKPFNKKDNNHSQDIHITTQPNGDLTITLSRVSLKYKDNVQNKHLKILSNSTQENKQTSSDKKASVNTQVLDINPKYIGTIIGFNGKNVNYFNNKYDCHIERIDKEIHIQYK